MVPVCGGGWGGGGSVCPVLRARVGRLGELYAQPAEGEAARAPQPPGHRGMLPCCSKAAKARGLPWNVA